MVFLGTLVMVILCGLLFLIFFYQMTGNSVFYFGAIGILSAIEILVLWRFATLRYFSLEHSGEVFTIKYCHPFLMRKTLRPLVEFPKEKLQSLCVEKCFFRYFVKIKIRNSRNKIRSFKYSLQRFSLNDRRSISNSVLVK